MMMRSATSPGKLEPVHIGNGTGAGYRPELDTLRAIAVLAVLLSHWLPGFASRLNWGLAGVYLFFVISGYVITRGLLVEKSANAGRIDYGQFFVRRVVRIWPIYFLTIGFLYFAWPGLKDGTAIWHVLFMSNFLFSADSTVTFPIHFWSLSVEQQFYLFWPLLVMMSRRNLLRACVAMLFIGPLSRWFFYAHMDNVTASYYATTSNLDCLAAGALLAICERLEASERLVNAAMQVAGIGGLVLLLVLIYLGGGHQATVWLGTAITALSVWLMAWLQKGPAVGKLFDNPVTVYLGRISYGIYVYHLIIGSYVFGTPVGKMSPEMFTLVSTLATLVVATVSWYLIERPLLARMRSRRASVLPPTP